MTEKKPSRFMCVFPDVTFTPRTQDEKTLHVDAEVSSRCLLLSEEIHETGKEPRDAFEDAMNTIALGLSNISMWVGVPPMTIIASLATRLAQIEKTNVIVEDKRKPLSVVQDDQG